jgi:hypothetical protein
MFPLLTRQRQLCYKRGTRGGHPYDPFRANGGATRSALKYRGVSNAGTPAEDFRAVGV